MITMKHTNVLFLFAVLVARHVDVSSGFDVRNQSPGGSCMRVAMGKCSKTSSTSTTEIRVCQRQASIDPRARPCPFDFRRYLVDRPGGMDELGQDEPGLVTDEELEASAGEWDEKVARYNTVHLTGRIGNDPEPRYLSDGKVVVNLSLASRRKYHNLERTYSGIKSGDEETDWYTLEIWGTTAEFVSKYVDKGTRVGVIGSLQVDEWVDKETNEPRNRIKIVVRDFDVLESRDEAKRRRSGQQGGGYEGGTDWPSPAGSGNFFS